MTFSEPTNPASPLRAYLLLTGTAVCWAANAVFSRMAVGEVSPMMLVTLRWSGVIILISVFASKYIRQDWPVLKNHLPFMFAMGGLGFALFNSLFYISGHFTKAVNIGILQGSIPVFVLIGTYLAYRAPTTALQGSGVFVTLLGVVIVTLGGHGTDLSSLAVNFGDMLMLAACILYAGYTVALRNRPPSSALGLFTVIAIAAFLTSLPMLAVEYALGYTLWPTPKGWMVAALATVFPSFLAQLWFIHGVEKIGPGRAGIFVNLVPVFTAILGVGILSEPFGIFHASALALVLGGIWLSEKAKPQ